MTIPGFKGRIHPAGWPFITIFAAITLIVCPFSVSATWVGFIFTGWCVYFFRDPDRVLPLKELVVVSPADGLIQNICPAPLPQELGDSSQTTWLRISIFLNIFDVHVNRMPVSGTVEACVYHPGQFLNASLDKSSELNERQSLLIKTPHDISLGCVQIAGLIARRIVCDVKQGDTVQVGQRFGIIRFGSRVDIYVPADFPICVVVGQRAIGGETILAQIPVTSSKSAKK